MARPKPIAARPVSPNNPCPFLRALVAQGLTLELFHEFDHTVFARWPFMQRTVDGVFRLPAGTPRLPLLYSLRARLL